MTSFCPRKPPSAQTDRFFAFNRIFKNATGQGSRQMPETIIYFIINRRAVSMILPFAPPPSRQIVSIENQDNCGLAEGRCSL
ncbi:hypothetical protein TH25_07995 [Thalassospira profundimaris]|uniref:Uncharacterized protein n=1 Tax=Thalassospira profundimaris TaxID=502049 RepID=A0A367XER3_9PROT|nr:hypothetical protein TH25_07995 [Thalassospira profundimaris]